MFIEYTCAASHRCTGYQILHGFSATDGGGGGVCQRGVEGGG